MQEINIKEINTIPYDIDIHFRLICASLCRLRCIGIARLLQCAHEYVYMPCTVVLSTHNI